MTKFEEKIQQDLHRYLLMEKEIDQRLPDAVDIEEKWEAIAQAYLPDGIREYNGYPTVSLGWMMYVGMAVAKYWDTEWEVYGKVENLYLYLKEKRGYDNMDEYIREEVLQLKGEDYSNLEHLVAECASRTHSQLYHADYEPGTKAAFMAYVDCLHQMYQMGAAVQLNRMGYHMTKIN